MLRRGGGGLRRVRRGTVADGYYASPLSSAALPKEGNRRAWFANQTEPNRNSRYSILEQLTAYTYVCMCVLLTRHLHIAPVNDAPHRLTGGTMARLGNEDVTSNAI